LPLFIPIYNHKANLMATLALRKPQVSRSLCNRYNVERAMLTRTYRLSLLITIHNHKANLITALVLRKTQVSRSLWNRYDVVRAMLMRTRSLSLLINIHNHKANIMAALALPMRLVAINLDIKVNMNPERFIAINFTRNCSSPLSRMSQISQSLVHHNRHHGQCHHHLAHNTMYPA
jgi:hypothetical protein